MSHITIPIDSSLLHHYILPNIRRLDDDSIQPNNLFKK